MAFSITSNNENTSKRSEIMIRLYVKKFNEETNQEEKIYLPLPLFLDTMKPNVVSGTGEFQTLLLKGNDLRSWLIKQGMKLKPGQSIDITKMGQELYRRKEDPSVDHVEEDFDLF